MPHVVGLEQLHAFSCPVNGLIVLQIHLFAFALHRSFDFRKDRLCGLNARPEIADERKEERSILGHELRHVHVSYCSHHQHRLVPCLIILFYFTCSAQHAEDIAQAEIVVGLLRQLKLAQLIEDEKFLGKDGIFLEAARS